MLAYLLPVVASFLSLTNVVLTIDSEIPCHKNGKKTKRGEGTKMSIATTTPRSADFLI